MSSINERIPKERYESIKLEYCSVFSRESQVDPIGTAASYERYLLVEVPLPWEMNVEHSSHFPSGLKDVLEQCMLKERNARFLGFVSDSTASPQGYTRVFYYELPSLPATGYSKREYLLPVDRLNQLVKALLLQEDSLAAYNPYLQPTEQVRELFVCTHGVRDRCCGKFGYPIYKEIEEKYASVSEGSIRVWRTSHIGGHRYAPTMIDFPEGRWWAQLSGDILDTIIWRKGSFSSIAHHYRGWSMIGPFEQVAERELLSKKGWEWITFKKQANLLKKEDRSALVRIHYSSPDNKVAGAYEADVYISGTVQVGGCGKELNEVKQYGIRQLTKV